MLRKARSLESDNLTILGGRVGCTFSSKAVVSDYIYVCRVCSLVYLCLCFNEKAEWYNLAILCSS